MRVVIASVLLFLTAACFCDAAAPKMSKGVRLEAGDKVIDAEIGHLVPDAVDWNADGKKDLLVGQFKGGAIQLYLNKGSDASPQFGEPEMLEAAGEVIKLDAG